MAKLKLISWNVNGIRAVVKKGFGGFLNQHSPDVLGLQEIKITDTAREKEAFNFVGYTEYWFPAVRPGYSGTAILTKTRPLSYVAGLGIDEFDNEGRVQTAEFEDFYFVNCYFPNVKDDLSRLDYKQRFNQAILRHVKKLEQTKPVIICGDFNVAHEPIDLARPKENEGKKGFTKEERMDMAAFLESGLIDTYRKLNPERVQYSWWSYYSLARDRNIGWRIDYFLASGALRERVTGAFILDDVWGSDHCPVGIELKL
jgi:exodeoxyribonuclease III